MYRKTTKTRRVAVRVVVTIALALLPVLYINSQVVADFTADDTLGCTPFTVHFTYTGTPSPDYDYLWTFGSFGTRTDQNPFFIFNSSGTIPVTLKVTDRNTSQSDEITKFIYIILTPSANLIIDSTNACVHGDVEFRAGFSAKDSAFWDFGDGSYSNSISSYMYHAYKAHGSYNIQYITYYQECSDTSDYTIWVNGPIANITIDPEETCKNSPITFYMEAVYDVTSFYWDMGGGNLLYDNPSTFSYDAMGYFSFRLHVSGASGSCTIQDTLYISEVIANFDFEKARCHLQPLTINNTSLGNNNNFWDLGNGTTSLTASPTVTYSAGTYQVKLKIENHVGCTDSVSKELVVHTLPEINIMNDTIVCPQEESRLRASGGHVILWSPLSAFDDPASYTPVITPDSNAVYTATVTDTLTHCSSSDEVMVYVQEGFIQDKILVFPVDTSLIIGETFTITVYDSLSRLLTFNWSPDVGINCTDCPDPTLQPLRSTVYSLVISDTNRCFMSETFEINVEVRELYRIGVPDAFTPNNDGINDIIKVDGWGIQELIEFKIFNRWGIEVFSTDNIDEGWDGYYKNKLQNVDTYSYLIRARMWDENITTVQGAFSLLR